MPSLKEYTVKIARLRSTRKMTRTMKMVSANKLRKSQELLKQVQAYESSLRSALKRASGGGVAPVAELGVRERPSGRALVLLITSDRGLCGGFNNNLNRMLAQWLREGASRPDRVALSFCGRRGFLFFRSRAAVEKCYRVQSAKPVFTEALRIYRELQRAFEAGRFNEVYLAYNRFKSSLSQVPVVERLLPVEWPEPETQGADVPILYLTGPALALRMMQGLGAARVFAAMVASAAGEHGARMTAMENSTTNADNLIAAYSLRRNRARQAAITRELSEITAGAEALR